MRIVEQPLQERVEAVLCPHEKEECECSQESLSLHRKQQFGQTVGEYIQLAVVYKVQVVVF